MYKYVKKHEWNALFFFYTVYFNTFLTKSIFLCSRSLNLQIQLIFKRFLLLQISSLIKISFLSRWSSRVQMPQCPNVGHSAAVCVQRQPSEGVCAAEWVTQALQIHVCVPMCAHVCVCVCCLTEVQPQGSVAIRTRRGRMACVDFYCYYLCVAPFRSTSCRPKQMSAVYECALHVVHISVSISVSVCVCVCV